MPLRGGAVCQLAHLQAKKHEHSSESRPRQGRDARGVRTLFPPQQRRPPDTVTAQEWKRPRPMEAIWAEASSIATIKASAAWAATWSTHTFHKITGDQQELSGNPGKRAQPGQARSRGARTQQLGVSKQGHCAAPTSTAARTSQPKVKRRPPGSEMQRGHSPSRGGGGGGGDEPVEVGLHIGCAAPARRPYQACIHPHRCA